MHHMITLYVFHIILIHKLSAKKDRLALLTFLFIWQGYVSTREGSNNYVYDLFLHCRQAVFFNYKDLAQIILGNVICIHNIHGLLSFSFRKIDTDN